MLIQVQYSSEFSSWERRVLLQCSFILFAAGSQMCCLQLAFTSSALVLCLSVPALCTLGRDDLWAVLSCFHLKRGVKLFNLRAPAFREQAKGQEFEQHVFPSHTAMRQPARTQTQQAVQLQCPFRVTVPRSSLLWCLIQRTLHGMPGTNLLS